MKTRLFFLLLCGLVFASPFVRAQNDFHLPQVADGQGEGLIVKTTFILFNPGQDSVGVQLSLTDNDGNALEITIADMGAESIFAVSLSAGETRFLETAADGPLKIGAAVVQATGPVGVSAVFTILDSAGSFLTEAGVGSSAPMQKFVIPIDTTESFDTGLALFNVGAIDAAITFRIRTTAGGAGPEESRTLAPFAHRALYVSELFSQLGAMRGTLEVESTRPLAAIVLRQNLSTFTSTTLPVVQSDSQLTEFQLPQVANGVYAAGSIRTTFVLFNLSEGAAQVDVNLTADDGSPFPVSIVGGSQNSSSFHVDLAPGASAFVQTSGAGALTAGGARVASNVPVGVACIFTLYDGQGAFQTEAGVGNSPALSSFTIPVDTRAQFDTGVALFNPGSIPAGVTVRLLDADGIRVQVRQRTLPPGGHEALLVRNAFEGASLQGTLSITSTTPLSALTLRLNAAPLSYTTLPRAARAFAGIVPRPALLTKRLGGIAVDSAVALDVGLDLGYRLKGAVGGDVGTLVRVTAQAQDGSLFPASVDVLAGRYSVAVPSGAYFLIVCYKPALSVFQGAPTLIFDSPEPITVEADTVADIDVPKTNLFAVSGEVKGLGTQAGSALVRFTAGDGRAGGEAFISMDNRFSAYLPSGSYTTSLAVNVFGDFGTNHLAIYKIGSVTVAGADVTQLSVQLPASLSTLLGKVQITGQALIPSGSFVSAIDTAAPSALVGGCLPDAWTTSLAVGPLGDYRGLLPTDHGFDLKAHVRLQDAGYLLFPLTSRHVTLSGNLQESFSLAAAPQMIPVSGTVRAPDRSFVDKVTVTATSNKLAGVDQASASVSGVTNSLGEFQLSLPAGSDYTLTFTPPAP
ncbi:MAG: hypothetical protein ACE15E_05905 [Acidobacteriota bacterium]